VLLAAILLVFQIVIFASFAGGLLSGAGYVLCHIGSCFVTWQYRRLGANHGEGAVFVLQIALWTALAGPFGTVLSFVLLIPKHASSSLEQPAIASEPRTLNGFTPERLEMALLDSRLPLERALPPKSLFDVLAEGTRAEKFEALGIIAQSYDPALAPALRRALADADAPVRVLAATVLAKLRASFVKQVGAMQSQAARAPHVPGWWRDLARARFELARSGLLDTQRSREEISRAEEELGKAAALEREAAAVGP
jgi:hypothetical protein